MYLWVVALATAVKLSISAFRFLDLIRLQRQVLEFFFLMDGNLKQLCQFTERQHCLQLFCFLSLIYLLMGDLSEQIPNPFCVISLSDAAFSVLSMNAGKHRGSGGLKWGSYQSCREQGRKRKKRTPR